MASVILSEEVGKAYAKLQAKTAKGDGMARYLLSITDRGIAKIALDPSVGKKIPKKIWPREYIRKYKVNNLWKLNLDSYWRMIYTLRGDHIEIISLVLDILNHKGYSRKFGYKK